MSYYEEKKKELEDLIDLIKSEKEGLDRHARLLNSDLVKADKELKHENFLFNEYKEKEEKQIKKDTKSVRVMAKERQIGFPWLAEAYSEYFELQDKEIVEYLYNKSRPAEKAGDIVKELSKQKRNAVKSAKTNEYLLKYYESIAPFLIDLKEEVDLPGRKDRDLIADYTEEEQKDKITNYLTKEEYRKLPSDVKHQMALDRFWKRPKSKWLIGKLYERYVGYIYEEKGYDVEYVGIFKGFEDLGRDLICTKNNKMIIIQCKNWSKFKTIYEKHIFQFFGTVFQYKDENPEKNVEAMFYSTTKLSGLAVRFSKELKIDLEENHKFDQSYPCVKCNISKVDGSKIYHLPFDQQYDTTKIEKDKGEFYCRTVKEAEEKGFRRAFRYKAYKK